MNFLTLRGAAAEACFRHQRSSAQEFTSCARSGASFCGLGRSRCSLKKMRLAPARAGPLSALLPAHSTITPLHSPPCAVRAIALGALMPLCSGLGVL
jgi:hypothetical protein